jgi:hypothetical protein
LDELHYSTRILDLYIAFPFGEDTDPRHKRALFGKENGATQNVIGR